jgi:hypothetical protein
MIAVVGGMVYQVWFVAGALRSYGNRGGKRGCKGGRGEQLLVIHCYYVRLIKATFN